MENATKTCLVVRAPSLRGTAHLALELLLLWVCGCGSSASGNCDPARLQSASMACASFECGAVCAESSCGDTPIQCGTCSGTSVCDHSTHKCVAPAAPNPTADCFEYSSFDGTNPLVSFKTDVLPLFRVGCGLSSSCHGSETPPTPSQQYYGPSISAGEVSADQVTKIIAGIVDQPSVVEPKMAVVRPGDPEQSFLMYKLDGTKCYKLECSAGEPVPAQCPSQSGACGTVMPQGGGLLPLAKRDTIRRWIAQGAKSD